MNVSVQTVEGNDAHGAVASEITAMFEHVVMPWIQSFYLHQDTPFEDLCKEYCAMRGWPETEWPTIHIPASFVIDNDPRHAMMRQYIALPRIDMAKQQDQWLERFREDELWRSVCAGADAVGQEPPPKRRRRFAYVHPVHHEVAHNLKFCDVMLDHSFEDASAELRAELEEAKRRRDEQRAAEAVQQATEVELDRFAARNGGLDLYQLRVWFKARSDFRFLCVRPEQWAVHPPNTPELNCPAEHMVKTLKLFVANKLRLARCNFELLKLGKPYQQWVEEAVRERANGARGRWHIMRSIEKLPCIHRILAHNEGEEFEVTWIHKRWAPHEHPELVAANPELNCDHGRGGHPVFDARKRHRWAVKGTGGHVIKDKEFT